MESHNICPHGVSTDYRVTREIIDGDVHESWHYTECLKCIEAMGVIVLMNMLAGDAPPSK